MRLTNYDFMLGHPPDDALPDHFVDQLNSIEREFRGLLSDAVSFNVDGEPGVQWTAAIHAVGWDQREAVAGELERLAKLLRKH